MLVGVVAGAAYDLCHGGFVGIPAVRPAFDQLPTVKACAVQGCIQGIFLDVARPADQVIQFIEDHGDLFVGQRGRQFEIVLCHGKVGFYPFPAGVAQLAESAPASRVQVAFALVGLIGQRAKRVLCPIQQVVLGNRICTDAGKPGLVDGRDHCVDIVQFAEHIERTEGVKAHLTVAFCRNGHPCSVFEINHVERTVRDDDRVTCAVAVLHPAGVVQLLFHHDDGIGAGFPNLLQQFQHEGCIAGSRVLHGAVVILKADGGIQRVVRFHAQQLPELEFAQFVSFAALGGVDAAVVRDALGQPDRGRAV